MSTLFSLRRGPRPAVGASVDPGRRQALSRLLAQSAGAGVLATAAMRRAQAAPEASPAAVPVPWPPSRPVPPLALPALEGAPWSLAQQRGQVVLLNFWASWCAPCRAELPSLELLAHRLAPEGLRVAAVNFREGAAAIQRFLQSELLSVPVLLDADGSVSRAWGARILPTSVLIDRTGRPLWTITGEVDWTGPEAREWLAPAMRAART
jgi:thiol-disulfide isomerase/thioredoxin